MYKNVYWTTEYTTAHGWVGNGFNVYSQTLNGPQLNVGIPRNHPLDHEDWLVEAPLYVVYCYGVNPNDV